MAFEWSSHGDPMVRGSLHYTSSQGHRLVPVPGKGKKLEYQLHHPDGHVESLGKRATLDHAERAIQARQREHHVQIGNPQHRAEAHQHAMLHGPKGGSFYVDQHGQKVYGKR